MTIWTTPKYKALFAEGASLKVLPEERARKGFAAEAAPGDMAVLGLEGYEIDFLATLKSRGINCPVVFLTPEPVTTGDELVPYNALILDLRKMGVPDAMRVVNFIARITSERASEGICRARPNSRGAAHAEEGAPETQVQAGEVIAYHMNGRIPVVAALQFCRAGEVFTARLTCEVRSAGDDSLVLHKFRPSVITGDLKLKPSGDGTFYDAPFRHGHELELNDRAVVIFSHGDRSYEAVLKVLDISEEKMTVAAPVGLLHERRKNLRIEPDPSKPVDLYALVPGEPTMSVTLTDISQRGVGFVSERDFAIGDVLDFTIVVPEPRAVVLAQGEIMFKKKQGANFRYGAGLGLHPWDEEKVFRYIMRRELEIIERLRQVTRERSRF
ncbi:MAG: hypothetical protein Kow0025_16010 [Thermodesulfovibrionales bacterium]